jgi:hypothetical protein
MEKKKNRTVKNNSTQTAVKRQDNDNGKSVLSIKSTPVSEKEIIKDVKKKAARILEEKDFACVPAKICNRTFSLNEYIKNKEEVSQYFGEIKSCPNSDMTSTFSIGNGQVAFIDSYGMFDADSKDYETYIFDVVKDDLKVAGIDTALLGYLLVDEDEGEYEKTQLLYYRNGNNIEFYNLLLVTATLNFFDATFKDLLVDDNGIMYLINSDEEPFAMFFPLSLDIEGVVEGENVEAVKMETESLENIKDGFITLPSSEVANYYDDIIDFTDDEEVEYEKNYRPEVIAFYKKMLKINGDKLKALEDTIYHLVSDMDSNIIYAKESNEMNLNTYLQDLAGGGFKIEKDNEGYYTILEVPSEEGAEENISPEVEPEVIEEDNVDIIEDDNNDEFIDLDDDLEDLI